MKIRLDKIIMEKNPNLTRTKIQSLIKNGSVLINGIICKKNGHLVSLEELITIDDSDLYVSRAADKLKYAIDYFKIKIENLICMDIGSSTGGFCQVLLNNNAKYIYAIDVGTNQMHIDVKNNNKIHLYEQTNFKNVTKEMFSKKINLITCDVSFISSKIILEKIKNLIDYPVKIILLIKPQFEMGINSKKKDLNDSKIHQKIIDEFIEYFEKEKFQFLKIVKSPVLGKSGNQEYLTYLSLNYEK